MKSHDRVESSYDKEFRIPRTFALYMGQERTMKKFANVIRERLLHLI